MVCFLYFTLGCLECLIGFNRNFFKDLMVILLQKIVRIDEIHLIDQHL